MTEMHYETNKESFDFPSWVGRPEVCYAIVSTPRSGSNMLVRALWQSGVAGAPEEYLTPLFMSDFTGRFGRLRENLKSKDAWLSGNKIFDGELAEYVKLLMRIRTSPNGVFGLKLHASHFSFEHLSLIDVNRVIQLDKVIRITRKNKVRQAISLIFATETDQWIDDPEWNSISKPLKKASSDIEYDEKRIHEALGYLEELETFSNSLIENWKIPSLEVSYEDLCDKYSDVMKGALDFLGVETTSLPIEVNIRKQDDPVKEQWYERFVAST